MSAINPLCHNLELISLQIPKTAGTSFRNILKAVYGNNVVIRFDINEDVIKINEKKFTGSKLKKRTKVIHGHFEYTSIKKNIELSNSIPIITWLRDPVERVISNYFYLKKIIQEKLNENNTDSNLGNRMLKSIEEFASFEENRNRMSKFLKGALLEDFFFIGIVERFEEDIKTLSQLLDWKSYPIKRQNQTSKEMELITTSIREEIKKLNEQDVDVYKEVLNIRKKRK